jgi:hypothetical protein
MASEFRRLWGALTLLAAFGCGRTVDERDAAAEAASKAVLDDLTIRVEGGVVVQALAADDDHPVRLRLRATSFDVQVVIEDEGCAVRPIDVTVENVPADAAWTWRGWRGALTPAAEAERRCCGTLVGPRAADAHPDWTPLGPESSFVPGHTRVVAGTTPGAEAATTCRQSGAAGVVEAATGDTVTSRCWRMQVTPSADQTLIVAPDTTLPPRPTVACADFDSLEGGSVRQAPLIMVQRGTWRPAPVVTESGDVALRFAVFGNHAGEADVRQAVVQAVSARVATDDLRFALITGDLADRGSTRALDAAVTDLNRLPVPWFATVGERDVDGANPEDLVERFGRLTDAFDVYAEGGAVGFRVVLLDSADGGLSRSAFRKLDAWLDDPLAPETRLVVTHKPPFEPHGLRGKGFKSRSEAARLVAALHRGAVENLFSGHLAIFQRQVVGDLIEWHSGGGGAPMDTIENDSHHFLVVTVNQLGAIFVERVDL